MSKINKLTVLMIFSKQTKDLYYVEYVIANIIFSLSGDCSKAA